MKNLKIDNMAKVKDLFKSDAGDEAPIIGVPMPLIHFLGCPKKALLLAQLIYLSDKGKRTDGFVFKNYDEIHRETGIKERTCNRFYKEFKEMGFFDWTTKKAYGAPTVHFKIDMVKLSELIQTFCRNENRQNVANETVKMSETLTENTTKNTYIDNTLSTTNRRYENAEEYVSSSDLRNSQQQENVTSSLRAAVPDDEAFAVSSDFAPTLENRLWAVTSFPQKSPEVATLSFVEFYVQGAGQGQKRPSQGWQSEWKKWMMNENVLKGYSKEKLEAEHEQIFREALDIVYRVVLHSHVFFFRCEWFDAVLGKEEYRFTAEDIEMCLKRLESDGYLATFFGDYYYVSKVFENNKWQKVDASAEIYYEWNSINSELIEFIENNPSTHRDEICGKYSEAYHSSIDRFLRAGIEAKELCQRENYYYHVDSNEQVQSKRQQEFDEAKAA